MLPPRRTDSPNPAALVRPRRLVRLAGGLLLLIALAACGEESKPPQTPADKGARDTAASQSAGQPDCRCPDAGAEAPPKPSLLLTPASFDTLPGWREDSLEQAAPALALSCGKLLAQQDRVPVGPQGLAGTVGDWRPACTALSQAGEDPVALRRVLEQEFRPFLASDGSKSENRDQGFFTGYYEPEILGSRQRQGDYVWPLYRAPDDLLRVRLGRFRADLEGETLFGRLEGQELVPYYDRAAIDQDHVLAGRGLELVYLKDYIELFFLQVQGSGRVRLPDGQTLRVGYAANNGHNFTAIGRLLLDQGKIGRDEATAQGVIAWLRANPREAWDVMKQNARYIFFRPLEGEGGPLGAQGVPLTAGRSLAVDSAFLPLGAPLWLDTTWPGSSQPLRRLVVAQDVGGAIKGPVRGDLFWGTGAGALEEAGRMKQPGRYWLLLPRAVAERRTVTQ